MANRPVFAVRTRAPHVDIFMTDFTWNKGMAVSQKQKNITALHQAFNQRFPQKKVLEISSKSLQSLGVRLSAFNLPKYVPELDKSVPLECVFQGGKVFSGGGPYTDLYSGTARDAKGDPRLRSSGQLKSFFFDGAHFPLTPTTAFYNWLYIQSLKENPELARELLNYDAFTDIEFNPDRSQNCQAQAAALFVSLSRQGLLDRCDSFDTFVTLLK